MVWGGCPATGILTRFIPRILMRLAKIRTMALRVMEFH